MSESDKRSSVQAAADLSNPTQTQSILALIVVGGAVGTAAVASVAAIIRGADATAFVSALVNMALTALGFYFLDKQKNVNLNT